MVADEGDPHLLLPDGKVAGFAPQLYTLDGASYESVQVRPNRRSLWPTLVRLSERLSTVAVCRPLESEAKRMLGPQVGLFSILQCKRNSDAECPGPESAHEFK